MPKRTFFIYPHAELVSASWGNRVRILVENLNKR